MGNEFGHPRVTLLDRAAPQGSTGSQRDMQFMPPLLLLVTLDVMLSPSWPPSQGSRVTAAGEGTCSSRAYKCYGQRSVPEDSGQENTKHSMPNLQICARGLTIPAPKPTANLPLLPASAAAAHATPDMGQSLSTVGWATHGTSTAGKVQL